MTATFAPVALAAMIGALVGGTARAAKAPMPLPDFELTKPDGTAIRSRSELPNEGKYLIVYVQGNCRPCDRLLSLVKQMDHPALPSKLVIITGRSGPGVGLLQEKRADLAGAQWYADDSRAAWVALRMSGAPMVFGLRGRTVEWSLSGVLPSDREVKSILASWIAE